MGLQLKFKVESIRKIPNPYLSKEDGEKKAMMYMAICDVKNLPDNIPMETNPRKQKLTMGVPKKIKASLLDESYLDFYLLNRGLCISAADVTFNNYSNEICVSFDDFECHGDVDGGHTYKVILENRDKLDYGRQFVKLEFLTGVEDIFSGWPRRGTHRHRFKINPSLNWRNVLRLSRGLCSMSLTRRIFILRKTIRGI